MEEVRDLAQRSLVEARELVRGYRSITLPRELSGARSLLEAAGIDTTIDGDAEALAPEVAEVAAWAVREGVTNILRHSRARTCSITITTDELTIVNDGAPEGDYEDGVGLSGLRERLSLVGGELWIRYEEGAYRLVAGFTPRAEVAR